MEARSVEILFGRSVHPIYREQLHAVPTGWRYRFDHPDLTEQSAPTKLIAERGSRLAPAREIAERVALRTLARTGQVRRARAPASRATIIHAAEHLLRRSPVPYVVDFEHAALFVLYQPATLESARARRTLEQALLDPRLRLLLGWSDAATRSIASVVSDPVAAALAPKLRTVRPAIRPVATRARSRSDGLLRLLFVGTKFHEKGAVEAVRALRLARREHDVCLRMVTYAPAEWAATLAHEPGLELFVPAGADFVQRLYRDSDALLFPSHMDTFGYVVLEAMAHALPVLTADHLALGELVRDGENGLLFAPENMLYDAEARLRFRYVLPPPVSYMRALQAPSEPYVASIAAAIGRLADDRGLYDRLSAGALASVSNGPSSMDRRRDALAEAYAVAAA